MVESTCICVRSIEMIYALSRPVTCCFYIHNLLPSIQYETGNVTVTDTLHFLNRKCVYKAYNPAVVLVFK